jgi:tRNA threonylcarbamoyl adenosine modification protein YjeE
MKEHLSKSLEDTSDIAKDIAATLFGGEVLLLSGDLGAGKTTFSKALIASFGVVDEVTSPTFSLMNMYDLPEEKNSIKKIVHIDTYRLEHEEELVDIGIEDYLDEEHTLTIIEWPEKMSKLLEKIKTKKIHLEHVDEDTRNIKIDA